MYCYTQTQIDAKYAQINPDELKVVSASGPELTLETVSTRTELRYKNSAFRIRRPATNGALSNHYQFPHRTTCNTLFYKKIPADAFQTSSDERINDDYEAVTADES